MKHHELFRLAAWPCVVAIACVLLVTGCQDGSGPGLPTSPEGKPAFEGAKPPPPPPPTPADPAIASVTGTNRRTNLHVMNADGSNFTTIFSNSYNDSWRMSPSWSPDGGSIVFIRSTGPSNAIVTEISAIDVDVVNGVPTGTNLRALFAGRFSPFETAWSPLGDLIAYIEGPSIKTIPAAGGDPLVVYTATSSSSPRSVAWSRDGSLIAFSIYDDDAAVQVIRAVDVANGQVTTMLGPDLSLPITQGEWIRYLDWGRSRDVLAFSTGLNPVKIYTVELPGGIPALVTSGSHPTWSPSDTEIAFVGIGGGVSKVNLATGLVTAVGAGNSWPDWRRF